MAYQLKQITYKGKKHEILLQNENGPCPLLAAANCLLLREVISLPPSATTTRILTIDQLVNILAEKILSHQSSGSSTDHHVQEVLTIFPSLSRGMDVNPKFTAGPTGVEYTVHLNAFDLLHLELVHGWLIEPEAEEYDLIGDQTYNQLINAVIEGNEASSTLSRNEGHYNADTNIEDLSTKATKGLIINNFLERSSHQLTQYGLSVLHEYLNDGQLAVFFRNNHFNTLTKHEGLLYLLVTDFGYANVPTVVWEKIDTCDGDTEYVTDKFEVQPLQSKQEVGQELGSHNADFQLALQLSQEAAQIGPQPTNPTAAFDEEVRKAQEMSLQEFQNLQVATQSPGVEVNGTPKNELSSPFALVETATSGTTSSQQGHDTVAGPAENASTLNTPTPIVAMGIPKDKVSQEEQDRIFALQLQRDEEARRATQTQQQADVWSEELAATLQRQEREKQRIQANRPGAPPRPIPTLSTRDNRKDGCIIS